MERVDTCRTKEAIPPERDEASPPGRASVASQSRGASGRILGAHRHRQAPHTRGRAGPRTAWSISSSPGIFPKGRTTVQFRPGGARAPARLQLRGPAVPQEGSRRVHGRRASLGASTLARLGLDALGGTPVRGGSLPGSKIVAIKLDVGEWLWRNSRSVL